MSNTRTEVVDEISNNVDFLQALSNVALTGMDRLAALNLTATRSALDEGYAAYCQMIEADRAATAQHAAPNKATQNALAYFQGLQSIATDIQQDVTRLMTTLAASQANGMGQALTWFKGFEALQALGNPMSDASRKAMAGISSSIVNATAAQSRKRAAA